MCLVLECVESRWILHCAVIRVYLHCRQRLSTNEWQFLSSLLRCCNHIYVSHLGCRHLSPTTTLASTSGETSSALQVLLKGLVVRVLLVWYCSFEPWVYHYANTWFRCQDLKLLLLGTKEEEALCKDLIWNCEISVRRYISLVCSTLLVWQVMC